LEPWGSQKRGAGEWGKAQQHALNVVGFFVFVPSLHFSLIFSGLLLLAWFFEANGIMNPMDSCFGIGYTNRLGKGHTEKMWTKLGGSIVTRCPVARLSVASQGRNKSVGSDAASHGIFTKGVISDSQKSPNIRMSGSSASNLRM